jgi:hypothetical protein
VEDGQDTGRGYNRVVWELGPKGPFPAKGRCKVNCEFCLRRKGEVVFDGMLWLCKKCAAETEASQTAEMEMFELGEVDDLLSMWSI